MTSPDDDPARPEPQVPLDEEAAWLAIVENYGDRPEMGPEADTVAPVAPEDPAVPHVPPVRFDRSYLDAMDARPPEEPAALAREEEHFVPPEPPAVPRPTPARRLAWLGLFLSPVLMLVAVVFGLAYPPWVTMLLVASFVGGFVFLVATMPSDDRDGWDDGAVV